VLRIQAAMDYTQLPWCQLIPFAWVASLTEDCHAHAWCCAAAAAVTPVLLV
jgi:hypothetical protein